MYLGSLGNKSNLRRGKVVDDIRSRLTFTKIQIAYVWAMVFMGIVIYSMFWFIFGMMLYNVTAAIESAYTFQSPADNTVTLIKNVIAWHPIIAMFGWLLWGILNSMRRDVRTYETM